MHKYPLSHVTYLVKTFQTCFFLLLYYFINVHDINSRTILLILFIIYSIITFLVNMFQTIVNASCFIIALFLLVGPISHYQIYIFVLLLLVSCIVEQKQHLQNYFD